MANIPSDKQFKQPPLVEEAKPNPTDSEVSKVAQNSFTPNSDSTRSTVPQNINPNTDPSKTPETTTQVAASILRPRGIHSLRSQALYGQNKPPNDVGLKESFLKTLTLDRSDPKLKALQRNLIHSIKNPEILKEILSDLIDRKLLEDISCFFQSKRTRDLLFKVLPSEEVEQKIPSPELHDILINLIQHTPEEEITVEIFKELSKKQFFLSFEMFKKMDDPEKLEKIIPFLDQNFLTISLILP